MKKARPMERHHVQWAAQFATAAELCKRGCSVSFTMGNATPIADLIVMAPSGACFSIDVKGQQTKNFWRIKAKAKTDNLFYVLCFVALERAKTRFFVFTQSELSSLMSAYAKSGVKYDPDYSGINWATAFPYEDRWDAFPT